MARQRQPGVVLLHTTGRAEIGATDFAGGGWVLLGSIDEALEACMFLDNSTILQQSEMALL
ncbi:MAG: hypothetical protein ACRD3B_12850 [Candidatus Sulfotelmatobacter sp.]